MTSTTARDRPRQAFRTRNRAQRRSRSREDPRATAEAEWQALGTGVSIVVMDPASLAETRRLVEAEIEAVDMACSRFRPDSELTRANAEAGRWVEISPLFLAALEAAIWAARATGGAVDPTVGSALRLIGYDRDFSDVASSDRPIRITAVRAPGWKAIELDSQRRRVRIPVGAELDLGSTAKALAADRAAARVLAARASEHTDGLLVSLGGDVAVGGGAPAGGWTVLVAEDHQTPLGADGEVIAMTAGGLATSSTRVRRWTRGGVDYHHIIDPVTGLPAQGPWRTATVAASTCVEANTAATAAIVMGATAPKWLEARGLAARLVGIDGGILRLPGWPAPRQ
jgi:thiamine biosynthesis lipoprotein ApbE